VASDGATGKLLELVKTGLKSIRVLLTGCLAPGTEGTKLGLRSGDVEIEALYGCDQNLTSRTLTGFDRVFGICGANDSEYIAQLTQLIRDLEIGLVVPQTTPEIISIAKHWAELHVLAAFLMPNPPEAVILANDKLEVLRISEQLGMPTTNFLSLEQDPPIEEVDEFFSSKERVFLKHRNDSGGRGIVSLHNSFDWITEIMNKPSSSFHSKPTKDFIERYRKDSKSFSDFFLMESQEGQEYSVDIFRSDDKFIAVPRKRISVKSGVSNNVQIEKNEDLIHASKKIANHLDLRGLFGFQFIFQSSSNFSIIECNPRVQGTNIASVLAGSNLISWAAMYALNRKFEVNDPRWGVLFQRTNSGELIG